MLDGRLEKEGRFVVGNIVVVLMCLAKWWSCSFDVRTRLEGVRSVLLR